MTTDRAVQVLALLALMGCLGESDAGDVLQDGGRAQGLRGQALQDGGRDQVLEQLEDAGRDLEAGGRATRSSKLEDGGRLDASACDAFDMLLGRCEAGGDGDGDGDGAGVPCQGCPDGYPAGHACDVGAQCESCPAGCNPNPLTPGQADIYRCVDGQNVTCVVCVC